MAYSTRSDVEREFKGVTFSASTTPTANSVDAWIAEADAEIDARVGLKYVVPVSGAPNALLILRGISVALVAERVKEVQKVKTGADQVSQDQRNPNSSGSARKRLDLIVQGLLLLSDATPKSTTDGLGSFAVDNGLEHGFSMDEDQW